VVVVGAERAAVQLARPDDEPVVGLGDVAAEPVELGGQRLEPVGLVPAQVRDAAQVGRRLGERRSAATTGVSSPAAFEVRRRSPYSSPVPRTSGPRGRATRPAPIESSRSRQRVAGLRRVLRPAGIRTSPSVTAARR
jgi:hypothetical protein